MIPARAPAMPLWQSTGTPSTGTPSHRHGNAEVSLRASLRADIAGRCVHITSGLRQPEVGEASCP